MSQEAVITAMAVLCLFAGTAMATDSSSDQTSAQLPAALRLIIDRNQANWDAVKTLQGSMRIQTRTSYGDKGSLELAEMERIWWDRSHIRSDVLESKPLGEKASIVDTDDKGRTVTASGRSVGTITIDSAESRLEYHPGIATASVFPPQWDEVKIRHCNAFLNYQSVVGNTLKECVLTNAKNGAYPTVRDEEVGDDECSLIEYRFPRYDMVVRVWVAPSKGCAIKKLQTSAEGQICDEYVTTLKEYMPGIWWFDSVKAKHSAGAPGNHEVEVFVDSLTVNEPIDAAVFTLVGTDIPAGTMVRDLIAEVRYRYKEGFKLSEADLQSAFDSAEDPNAEPNAPSATPSALPNAQQTPRSGGDPLATRGSGYAVWLGSAVVVLGLGGGLFLLKRRNS
jgi:hypothetical protein